MDFETVLIYIAAGGAGVAGLWGVIKRIVAATPSKEDDEAFEKFAPAVDKVVNIGEQLANKDLDGDGDINDLPPAS